MSRPLVSVILTSYNKPELVGGAIESLINQSYSQWELWIMDDNSNQATLEEINKYLDDARIHFISSSVKDEDRSKTARYATLINQALSLAKGDYISYLAADTFYEKNRLEEMVKQLQSLAVDVVYSSQLIKTTDAHLNDVSKNVSGANTVLYDASFKVDYCSVMHTREILEKVKGRHGTYWDDNPLHWNHGDAVFWRRLNQFEPFYPIPKILDTRLKTPFQNFYKNLSFGLIDER